MIHLLEKRKIELDATDDETIRIFLQVAAGQSTFEEFSSWVHRHVKSKINSTEFEM